MTKLEKLEYMAALKERLIRESRTSLLTFTKATMPTFEPADFHRQYYSVLNGFAEKIGTNGVHPDQSGYLQIGDIQFRNVVASFCQ